MESGGPALCVAGPWAALRSISPGLAAPENGVCSPNWAEDHTQLSQNYEGMEVCHTLLDHHGARFPRDPQENMTIVDDPGLPPQIPPNSVAARVLDYISPGIGGFRQDSPQTL